MRVVNPIEAPDKTPVLARWYVAEWAPWYGPDRRGDAAADLTACSSGDTLPICLVALDGGGELLGGAALKTDSVGRERDEGPLLAAVLVAEGHRGKSVGTALVAAVEEEAARLGFESLDTSTDTAARILERRGWRHVGSAQSLRGQVAVYRRDLNHDWIGSRAGRNARPRLLDKITRDPPSPAGVAVSTLDALISKAVSNWLRASTQWTTRYSSNRHLATPRAAPGFDG